MLGPKDAAEIKTVELTPPSLNLQSPSLAFVCLLLKPGPESVGLDCWPSVQDHYHPLQPWVWPKHHQARPGYKG